jgi:hypothetical protein
LHAALAPMACECLVMVLSMYNTIVVLAAASLSTAYLRSGATSKLLCVLNQNFTKSCSTQARVVDAV